MCHRLTTSKTEWDRPIIWICHDIGGSIVKQVHNPLHTPFPLCERAIAIGDAWYEVPQLTDTNLFKALMNAILLQPETEPDDDSYVDLSRLRDVYRSIPVFSSTMVCCLF